MNENAPSIAIYLADGFSDRQVLREVLRGVEEESIPYEVLSGEPDDAVLLAYSGAERSALEVGIGLDNRNSLAVHYRKLQPGNPLFLLDYTKEPGEVRNAGANAARLVKNTPFKDN